MYLSTYCSVNGNWIIAGDSNINLLDNDSYADSFMNVLLLHCLYPSIFAPTRPCSKTLLGNIFLSFLPRFLR